MSSLKKFSIELVSMSVVDNVENFQVFEDDNHTLDVITSIGVFDAKVIDQVDKEFEMEEESLINLKR